MESLNVSISSPPDRDFLVADIMLGTIQIAEINQETGSMEIEIYASPDNSQWKINLDDFLVALNKAKVLLSES
ncbi:MAG: hypothetical protein F6K00_02410 [Leptolyngbya sp. SIOISBB]|nr:hypothetical protein [Leptolyngbya sp. SIOISBB]